MTQLIHNFGHSIELRTDSSHPLPLWRYVYGDGKPKPYFHPLCAPRSGVPLTNFEPYDHTWHRGLWFAIKYVNGVNFWEEADPFGVQAIEDIPEAGAGRDGSITLRTDLRWRYPDGRPALSEQRRVSYRPLADDAYAWDCSFWIAPAEETVFDRTPYTTWGGYGGLCVRGARHWRDTRFLLPGGETDRLRRGQRSPWCELYGQLDGGSGLSAGVAFFDHPDNPRHPTPFYGHAGDDQRGGPMLNAAFLFHEPMTLKAGESFRLSYRVLVHDGQWTSDQIQQTYLDYVKDITR